MRRTGRFLRALIVVLAVALISSALVGKAQNQSGILSGIFSQLAGKATDSVNSAAGQLSSAMSDGLSSSSSDSSASEKNSSNDNTAQNETPAIPTNIKITQAPSQGQTQAQVSTPTAKADTGSVWGKTGVDGLTVYEYGKTLLGNDEKAAYEDIAQAVLNVEPKVTIKTALSPAEIEEVYDYYVYDHSEVFYLQGVSLKYSQSREGFEYTFTFQYEYNADKSKIMTMREAMGAKALKVLKAAERYSTDLKKEKALHDKLIELCSYDVKAAENPSAYPESFSAYGVFVNHKAVCEGYAQAMKILLSSAGIKSLYITGQANGGSHAWNIVDIGGKWRYLDATFDDPVYVDTKGQYVNYNTVSYTYFNFKESTDHTVGKFYSSDPFGSSSENYETMPQIS